LLTGGCAILPLRKISGSAGGSGMISSAARKSFPARVIEHRRHDWFTGDIPEAARRLQIAITPHSVVAKRTADRTAKINDAISEAIDSPDHD
jgi:hypothetical protein